MHALRLSRYWREEYTKEQPQGTSRLVQQTGSLFWTISQCVLVRTVCLLTGQSLLVTTSALADFLFPPPTLMTKPSYNLAVCIVDSFDIVKHFERAITLEHREQELTGGTTLKF